MVIEPIKEEELQAYHAKEYAELRTYEPEFPNELLSLGLIGISNKMAELDRMLGRLQGMLEEAQREFSIKETVHKSVEDAYKDTLAIMIHTGITGDNGQIVYTKDEVQKMRSVYMQESAAMQNPDFAKLAIMRRKSSIDMTLAEGYLEAVKSRHTRLTKAGYTLNAAKEVLLKSLSPDFTTPSQHSAAVHGSPATNPFEVEIRNR
jgi:virulence-associated protein VapD